MSDRHEQAAKPVPGAGPPKAIETPCVQVCIVDGPSGLCLGCYRTLAEIGGWRGLTDEARAAVMAELPDRSRRIDPTKLGSDEAGSGKPAGGLSLSRVGNLP